jgi:hypothetical protein
VVSKSTDSSHSRVDLGEVEGHLLDASHEAVLCFSSRITANEENLSCKGKEKKRKGHDKATDFYAMRELNYRFVGRTERT